ncbi:unknown [Coprobacillus sp. CAG:826]|jgi:hypothetical protein|nr:hypothetical protein [Coprobacillus sp.]CDD92272.1 unknown [Coprobacillus sp. CAG:826]
MKTKKKKEQFEIANVLFEMGMDFDVIESVAGVTPQELLLNKINILDFQEEIDDNNNDSYQESRNQRNEQTR